MSNNFYKRMNDHNKNAKYGRDHAVYNAIRKYGNIEEFEVLEFMNPDDRESMYQREKYWIAYFNSNNPKLGYNMTSGGDGVPDQKGCNSPKAKLNTEQFNNVIHDLKYDYSLTMPQIADKYNVTCDIISNINNGKNYIVDDIEYPIRTREQVYNSYWALTHSNFTEESLNALHKELEKGELSTREIAKKFNVTEVIVNNINSGRTFYNPKLNYPIKKTSKRYKYHELNQEEIDEIFDLLLNSSLSQNKIADKYDVSKHLINKINKGEKYFRENIDYPIRKIKRRNNN